MGWFSYLSIEFSTSHKNHISKKYKYNRMYFYQTLILKTIRLETQNLFLLSDPYFENHAIENTEFFLALYICNIRNSQSISDFIILAATTKISKNNLTMCMLRPNNVFVEIAQHQNTIITECTITATSVRRLKHKKVSCWIYI